MVSERLRFVSQDLKIEGLFVGPDTGVALGGILCITGGGETDCEIPYGEWQGHLAEAGFASLSFNARGVGESEGSFRTDSDGYHPENSPANSQATRTADAEEAFRVLADRLEIQPEKVATRTGVIGGSMGGDIALHTRLETAAVILRAPAAYPDELHSVPYGPEWGPEAHRLGGAQAALQSVNFSRIAQLTIPKMVIYPGGDTVIPSEIQLKYRRAFSASDGLVLTFGDESVPHTYINIGQTRADTEQTKIARKATFNTSIQYFEQAIKR